MVQGHRANDFNRSGRICAGCGLGRGRRFTPRHLRTQTCNSQGSGGSMTGAARRVVATAVGMVASAAPGVARASEYVVHACDDAAHNQNHLFVPSASDNRMSTDTMCEPDVNGHDIGMAAMAGVNKGTVPWLANSQQTFLAPAGAAIHRVRVKADAATWNGDWAALLQASDDRFANSFWNVSGCVGSPGSAKGCNAAVAAEDHTYDFGGATGFRSVVACGNTSGCTTFGTGSWAFSRAYYFMREGDVTLYDPSAPTVTLTDGGPASGGWVRGTQAVNFNATDNSGIFRSHFTVDDLGVIDSHAERCDYTYAVPCPDVHGEEYSVDPARLSDGPHRVV